MTNNLLKLLVSAVIAVASLSGCTISSSNGQLSDMDREMIKEQIRAELAQVPSLDSLANTPIVVSPTIEVKDNRSRDLLKLAVIYLPFLFTIVVLLIILHYKRANLLAKYRIIDQALEKGVTLPDAFYTDGKSSPVRMKSRQLTNGMMWVACGISGIIFFIVVDAEVPGALCIFPVLVGVVKIISSYLDNKNHKSGVNAD